jgi:hypothetical protein
MKPNHSHEQITLTVPRGTRAWLREAERKTGITPENILRLGITEVGRFVERYNAAKNSEPQSTSEKGETHEVSNQAGDEAGPSQEPEGERDRA